MKRILLIGLGRWGANHLRILKSMPIELFVSDVDPEKLAESGVPPSYQSAEARSLFPKIDGAIVATPAQTHFALGWELLEMDKDVFVEKPITLISDEGKKLTDLAKKRARILQAGHIFRFDSASLWLRDAIGQGQFGRVKTLRGKFYGFKRPRADTGVTFADGIHFIDLFNFFLGRTPRRVHAVLGDFMNRGMDDESLVSLEYEHEGQTILALVETGYHAPGKVREVVITGEELSAVCDYNVAQYKIKTFQNRHARAGAEITASEGAVRQIESPPEEPLRAELAAFVDSMETRERPLADGQSGFQAVAIVEAALESARTARWIDIVA
jgi:UDP-2-acetamido-3-amino-2,3-dideoxy-glucuronate N-acetyltransferase